MSETLDETSDAREVEAGAVDEPEARAEPEAEVAAPTPASAEVDWNNVENLRAAAQHLQSLGYTIAQAEQPQPEASEPPAFVDEFGQLDPQGFQAFLAHRDSQLVNAILERFAPVERYTLRAQQAEDERQIAGTVSSVVADAGLELDDAGTQAVRGIAYVLGQNAGVNDPRQATKLATDWLAARDKAQATAAVRAYQESIGQVAATPGEPSAAGGGLRMEPKPSSYDEIIAKYEGRIATV